MAKTPLVNIVKLTGVIKEGKKEGINISRFRNTLDKAFKTGRRQASLVVLYVSSPGGSPMQSEEVSRYIRHKHEETGIPVISCVSSAAASGGYWIALAGNEVYTLDNSLVGSIGVIASTFNFSDTIQRIGVQRKELTVGSHKGGLDPFLPHSEDREQEMKRLMNDLAENFYTWVKERRGNKLQQQPEDIFNGRVWIGSKATEIGLIDGTGSLESVLKKRYPRGYNPKFLAPRSRTGIFSAMAASAGAAFAEAFGSTILARLGIDDTDRYTFR